MRGLMAVFAYQIRSLQARNSVLGNDYLSRVVNSFLSLYSLRIFKRFRGCLVAGRMALS